MESIRKIKVVVGVNALSGIDSLVYPNHCQFWYNCGKNDAFEFLFFCPRRISIDRMRNSAAQIALEQDADYLMFIDDDVLIPPTAFFQLHKETDYDIISGLTFVRSYPFKPMAFAYTESPNNKVGKVLDHLKVWEPLAGTKVIKCDAIGFSCALIKVSLIKKMSSPYFITGTHNTEDIYFCIKAVQEFPDTLIGCHTGVSTGHIVDRYVVDPENRTRLIKFEERFMMEKPVEFDRGSDYIKELEKLDYQEI